MGSKTIQVENLQPQFTTKEDKALGKNSNRLGEQPLIRDICITERPGVDSHITKSSSSSVLYAFQRSRMKEWFPCVGF